MQIFMLLKSNIKLSLITFILLLVSTLCSSNELKFPARIHTDKLEFKLVENVIILPVELNGKFFNFILDTGVVNTMFFSMNQYDYSKNSDSPVQMLNGLGNGQKLKSFKKSDNIIRIGKAYCENFTLFVVDDTSVDFTGMIGVKIDGIIGYDFFKQFAVEINYDKNFIKFTTNNFLTKKDTKEYEKLDISFLNENKPLIEVSAGDYGNVLTYRCLLDLGLNSSFWVCDSEIFKNKIELEEDVLLGSSLNDHIFGQRGTVSIMNIGSHRIRNPIIYVPKSKFLKNISIMNRQASLGSLIIRKFNVIIDYKRKAFYLKKNKYFEEENLINKTGIFLKCSKILKTIITERSAERRSYAFEAKIAEGGSGTHNWCFKTCNHGSSDKISYKYEYQIAWVSMNSVAKKSGIRADDKLLMINEKDISEMTLEDVNKILRSSKGNLNLYIERKKKRFRYMLKI